MNSFILIIPFDKQLFKKLFYKIPSDLFNEQNIHYFLYSLFQHIKYPENFVEDIYCLISNTSLEDEFYKLSPEEMSSFDFNCNLICSIFLEEIKDITGADVQGDIEYIEQTVSNGLVIKLTK